MHEASLIQNLVQTIQAIAQEQNATKVIAVKVRLGALSHLSPEYFSDHFAIAAQNTFLKRAQLDIETSDDVSDPMAQDIFLESVEVEMLVISHFKLFFFLDHDR
jgi:hydrogenase nickel incorporation protein HypA/HybF